MSAPVRVFALLGDAQLRRRVQMQWRSNGISLCGVHAEDGEFLVEELGRLQPQVVVADTEVDGVREFIQAAASRYRIPVIGLVRAQPSLAALQPLEWGAVTLVTCGQRNTEALLQELESTVQQTCGVQVVDLLDDFPLSGAFPDARVFDLRRVLRAVEPRQKVVVIAAGLGGPMAMRRILCDLRGSTFSPIVYTQHIAATLVQGLVPWLVKHTGALVQRVASDSPLEVGHVYVASSAQETVRIEPHAGEPRLHVSAPNGAGRPVDLLLQSAAEMFGARAVGVLLSGHGDDGCQGLLRLRAAGGLTITQDRASSLAYELPGRARDAGGAIECLPINEIAERLHMLMLPEHVART